jgi:ABC transport system ATP-binding/permease protein
MTILTLTQAQLAYGDRPLLGKTDFSLLANERVGLIGRNGTGKSSLLKVIAGLVDLDDGRCQRQSGLKFEYVAQEPEFGEATTVLDAVGQGFTAELASLREYDDLLTRMADHSDDAALERLGVLQAQLELSGIWQIRNRVDEMIRRCSLEADLKLTQLSGGQRKRCALARALVNTPDVLLLDEPTNHLDLSAIEWLENLTLEFAGTVLFITHDRQFLDRVATRMIELDRGQLASFPGNFTAYQTRKAELLHAESLANERFDKMLAEEEVWIRKGVEARRTRSVGRVARLEQMREQRRERLSQMGQLHLQAARGEQSGKLVAELTDVTAGYGDTVLIRELSTLIMRGDKVGLIGDNGVGKTTLLKLILGQLEPSSGSVRRGTKLEVAYFDQMRSALDEQASLADTISPGSEWIEINGQRKHVMSYLTDFLFSPARARSPVSSLSGGERNRLLLARLFARPANLLVLDEPTNDLDMESLELLEELLINYEGTVLLVSHDRRFLDQVVTQSLVHVGQGQWWTLAGGYQTWLAQRDGLKSQAARDLAAASAKSATTPTRSDSTSAAISAPERAVQTVKRSYKHQRLLEQLPKQIGALEAEQAQLQAQLADGQLFVSQPEVAAKSAKRISQIEDELLTLLDQWSALEAS